MGPCPPLQRSQHDVLFTRLAVGPFLEFSFQTAMRSASSASCRFFFSICFLLRGCGATGSSWGTRHGHQSRGHELPVPLSGFLKTVSLSLVCSLRMVLRTMKSSCLERTGRALEPPDESLVSLGPVPPECSVPLIHHASCAHGAGHTSLKTCCHNRFLLLFVQPVGVKALLL